MTYNKAQNARRILRYLRNDVYYYVKDPSKYKDFLTEDEFNELVETNKERRVFLDKFGYREDRGKPRPNQTKDAKEIVPKAYSFERIVDALKNNPDKNIRQSTKDKDATNIKSIFRLFDNITLDTIIENYTPEEFFEKLEQRYSGGLETILQTYLKLVESIKPVLGRKIGEDGLKYLRGKVQELQNRRSQRLFEERKADTTDYKAEFNKLQKTLKDIEKDDPNSVEHLLVALYANNAVGDDGDIKLIPRNYFHSVRITTKDTDQYPNYYNTKSKHLVLRDFKTSNTYQYNYRVNDYIAKLIAKSLKEQPRVWLIAKSNGDKYDPQVLNIKIKNLLGSGINQLRKILENYYLQHSEYDPVDIAKSAGHSIDSSRKSYYQDKESDTE